MDKIVCIYKAIYNNFENISHFFILLNINPNFDVNKYLGSVNEFAAVAAASTKFWELSSQILISSRSWNQHQKYREMPKNNIIISKEMNYGHSITVWESDEQVKMKFV